MFPALQKQGSIEDREGFVLHSYIPNLSMGYFLLGYLAWERYQVLYLIYCIQMSAPHLCKTEVAPSLRKLHRYLLLLGRFGEVHDSIKRYKSFENPLETRIL